MGSNNRQFIYVLKLKPKLIDENNWTYKEEEIVNNHFNVLQNMLNEGTLILAGRTLNMDENTFGIVVFEAESEEKALEIMNNDPAVADGIMTAELFPYKVALIRNKE